MASQNKGFTLIELLVVIAIIGILSTLAVVALGNARAKSRDSKRVADLKQISTALELYFSDNGSYPTVVTPGQSLKSPDGLTTYMANIPNNPTPRTDNGCPDSNYIYSSTTVNNNYYLYSCLGSSVGNLASGLVISRNGSSIINDVFSGLVAWWRLDEISGASVADSSGNNNSGNITGGINFSTNGKIGNAYSFVGSGGWISVPDSSVLNPSRVTISAWINPNNTSNQGIVRKDRDNAFSIYNGKIQGAIGASWAFYDSGFTPTINTWQQFVMTYDGAVFKFYKDGIAGNSFNISGSADDPSNNNPLKIGYDDNGWYFNGLIDDVRVYNRALSASEILALYNATN